jgi:hypothetical protein
MDSEASRARRRLIREHDVAGAVPKKYRDLVEIRFVLGRCGGGREELEAEQREYGDLLMLDMEENMNRGKSIEWLRSVNRAGEREALWVFKVDDDVSRHCEIMLVICDGDVLTARRYCISKTCSTFSSRSTPRSQRTLATRRRTGNIGTSTCRVECMGSRMAS